MSEAKKITGFDIDVNSVLANAQEELKRQVVESLKQSITWEVKAALAERIKAQVTEFYTAEIQPELDAQLRGEKSAILAAAVESVPKLTQAVTEAIVDVALKNLAASYRRDEIVKKIFGG